MRFGKASLKKPLILTVTSTRGRPNSFNGMTSSPTTRRDSSFQTGFTPSRARISAMSSPCVRMAAVPHTTIPTVSGYRLSSARYRRNRSSASPEPTSHESLEGSAFGSTE